MFQQALKRLFLILFPVTLFLTALCLSHIYPQKQGPAGQQHTANNCPFYLGVSFFSQKEIFHPNQLTTYTLNESDFIKKTQNLNSIFQKENLSLKQIFFSLPLTLTKEEEWIVSQKTFFILPTGERKQISHLTYSEINQFHRLPYQSDLSPPFSVKDSRFRGNDKKETRSNRQSKNLKQQKNRPNKQTDNLKQQKNRPNKQTDNLKQQKNRPNRQTDNLKQQGNNANKKERNLNNKNANQDYKALKLDKILSSLPKKSNFLFYLMGSDRKKIIKNLNKIQEKAEGDLYLSSSNEKLLKDLLLYRSCSNFTDLSTTFQRQKKEECLAEVSGRIGLPAENLSSALKANIKILHSFKTLIRLEILSILPQSFKHIQGEGLITPNSLPLDQERLARLKQENKLLFFEKEPPYTTQDKYRIENSQALISSQAQLAISSIKDKKACLIKN